MRKAYGASLMGLMRIRDNNRVWADIAHSHGFEDEDQMWDYLRANKVRVSEMIATLKASRGTIENRIKLYRRRKGVFRGEK